MTEWVDDKISTYLTGCCRAEKQPLQEANIFVGK